MPDGSPIPADVQRDDLAKDRSIEAIAKRVYQSMWPDGGMYSTSSDNFRRRFEAALAAEMQPVRRVRDEEGFEYVMFDGKWYEYTSEPIVSPTDLPPAYVGRAALVPHRAVLQDFLQPIQAVGMGFGGSGLVIDVVWRREVA